MTKVAIGAYTVPFDAISHIIAVIKLDSTIGVNHGIDVPVDRNGIVLPEKIDQYIEEYDQCVSSLSETEKQVVKAFFEGVSQC